MTGRLGQLLDLFAVEGADEEETLFSTFVLCRIGDLSSIGREAWSRFDGIGLRELTHFGSFEVEQIQITICGRKNKGFTVGRHVEGNIAMIDLAALVLNKP